MSKARNAEPEVDTKMAAKSLDRSRSGYGDEALGVGLSTVSAQMKRVSAKESGCEVAQGQRSFMI